MLIRNCSCYFVKKDSTTENFPAKLKCFLTLKRSICSGLRFHCSCEWYKEHIKLLKMAYFQRRSDAQPQEKYEELFLEGCRFQ